MYKESKVLIAMLLRLLSGARWLIGRMSDSQSREPEFESPVLSFLSLGNFILSTMPRLTQLFKLVPGYRRWWKCD